MSIWKGEVERKGVGGSWRRESFQEFFRESWTEHLAVPVLHGWHWLLATGDLAAKGSWQQALGRLAYNSGLDESS